MRTVVLTRQTTGDDGTFGTIEVAGKRWFTGELPWRDNASDVSCIPGGEYHCKVTLSPRFHTMLYELMDVPGRFACRIHPANFMGDKTRGKLCQLNGCIALGEKTGVMEGQRAIMVSRPAVTQFMKALRSEPFILVVNHVG